MALLKEGRGVRKQKRRSFGRDPLINQDFPGVGYFRLTGGR